MARRQTLFLESLDRADQRGVHRLALGKAWDRPGWRMADPVRDASSVGDQSDKPFLKDLFNCAAREAAGPEDWLLYSNVDCSFTPDLYQDLRQRRATVVEYMRLNTEGRARTLDELFLLPNSPHIHGLDAMAIRAGFWREIAAGMPDFVIGEPHWDTTWSEILRNLIPVQRDCERLYHPEHEQVWDLSHPTKAGAHNQKLYNHALRHGYATHTMIGEVMKTSDTAVVVPVFGNNRQRLDANIAGLRRQLRQDLHADLFLVEMLLDGQPSAYPPEILSQVQHIAVPAPGEAAEIFQKEVLMNMGWRSALSRHPYDHFIFADADVYCEEPDWFRRIRARIRENPVAAVQGFRMVTDTEDAGFQRSSMAAAFLFDRPTDLQLNPGICWGMHRAVIEGAGGFNMHSVAGGGDSMFVSEFLNTPEILYDPWLYPFRWFSEVYRDLPFRATLDCVPVDLIHFHHGKFVERNYSEIRYAVDGLPPLNDWLRMHECGVLAWRNPEGIERKVLRERARMISREAVDEVFREFGCQRYDNGDVRRVKPRPKPLFEIPGWKPPLLTTEMEDDGDEPASRRLNLFHPRKLYREEFPFSWCDGIQRPAGSTMIPTANRDGVPALVLHSPPEAPYVVVALPIETTWQPIDLTGHSTFRAGVKAIGPVVDLKLVFVSKLPSGQDIDSYPVKLECGGDVAIPLSSISGPDGFDWEHIRMVKLVGPGGMHVELSRVFID